MRHTMPEVQPGAVVDHREAKARVMSVLSGADPLTASRQALDQLTARNRELLNEDGGEIRGALADQVCVLEAIMLGFTYQAGRARRADDARALAGVALKASTALTQTLMALHRITDEGRNARAIDAR